MPPVFSKLLIGGEFLGASMPLACLALMATGRLAKGGMNRRRGPGIAPTTAPAARFAVLGGCPATLDLAAFWVFLRLWVLRAGWFLARSSGVCCGMTSSSL